MKKTYMIIIIISIIFVIDHYETNLSKANEYNIKKINFNKNSKTSEVKHKSVYKYPKFYRGLYLNSWSAKNFKKLKKIVSKAKESHINTLVLDIQNSKYRKCVIPKKNIEYCIKEGIHPIARIVVFPNGLKKYPVSKSELVGKLKLAEDACLNGFKEIQFDYIRFEDSGKLKFLSRKKRYQFIEGFLRTMKKYLKKYDVKIAADIYGRIPLNRSDIIGQRMEGLDKVVDIICPMAYPSHYWTKKLQNDPYYTVKWTSTRANQRTKNAQIVTYIQAFKWKMPNISFYKYIEKQIQAVHDSNIKGFLLWNAKQEYTVPLRVTKNYYSKKSKKVSKKVSKNNGKADI